MHALLPFLRLFRYAKFPLSLGILLMILGLTSSLGLLTLSGWFLAATAIAGIGTLFNFFYPSASVRGLAIGRTAARYAEKVVTHDATFRILAKLRVMVFGKIIPLTPAVLNRYRHSDLLNRLVADVDTLDSLYLRLLAPFVTAVLVIIGMTVGLSFINTPLALFIGCVLLVLLLVIPTLFYHFGRKFGADLTAARSAYRSQFVEFIQAQAELLLFNAEQKGYDQLNRTERQWQRYQQQEANLAGLSTAILLFANGLLLAFTLWFAAGADLGEGLYQAAFIALFAFAALASFEMLIPIGSAFLHIGQIIASAERVSEITDQVPSVQFNGSLNRVEVKQVGTVVSQNLLNLQQIDFHYPDHSNLALQNFSLSVNEGEKIAILGKTGSGKSTLLQLLVRNYDPNQGQILLAEQPIEQYTESCLRSQFCFLTQRVHVFSDTLRYNLQIAADEKIPDTKMLEVLKKVGLVKLASRSQDLDIWLGDGGRPLSGGEQRRLGLARVLLNNAPILLLDEPTEGLDRETERQVLLLIMQHSQNKTLLMVTHRLSLIEQFDRICVVDEGRLAEQGSYMELMAKETGFFKGLINRI